MAGHLSLISIASTWCGASVKDFGVRVLVLGVGLRCRVKGEGCRVCGVWCVVCGVVWGVGRGAWGVGCWVWGVGFRVWGVGCGVWVLPAVEPAGPGERPRALASALAAPSRFSPCAAPHSPDTVDQAVQILYQDGDTSKQALQKASARPNTKKRALPSPAMEGRGVRLWRD